MMRRSSLPRIEILRNMKNKNPMYQNVPTDNTSGTPEPEEESRYLDNGNIVREIEPEKEKNRDSLEHEKVKSHVSNFPTDNTL